MRSLYARCISCLALVAFVSAPGFAQTNAAEHRLVSYSASSGELANFSPVETVIYSHLVESPGAEWLRLTFRRVELGDDSYLRITAVADGAVQNLYPAHLQQWSNTSAYFNGSAVRVELMAGPGTSNVVEIGDLYAGMVPPQPFTQCGPTDDRVATNEPEQGRLLDIGCTAWLFSEDSCFASAGHCVATSSLVDVVQFNVPPSEPNGSLNHPGPEDQYAADTSDIPFTNGGIGNDWGMFRVFSNSETGLQPFEAQGAHLTIATTNPPNGDTINVVGYGVDSGVDNQVQQSSFGPLTVSNVNQLSYQSDTTGGNSGSGVKYPLTGEAVAIHTHGGCSTGGGSGANSGTAVTHPSFIAAKEAFCPATGGNDIPCGDLQNFQTRCVAPGANTLLQMRAIFDDMSHDGDTVTFTVDGQPNVVTINGRTARLSLPGTAGGHTIELTDPSGCVPAQTPTCP